MPDIVVKNIFDEEVVHSGVTDVQYLNTEGGIENFTHGIAVEDVPIELDLANGATQTIIAPEGTLVKSAIVTVTGGSAEPVFNLPEITLTFDLDNILGVDVMKNITPVDINYIIEGATYEVIWNGGEPITCTAWKVAYGADTELIGIGNIGALMGTPTTEPFIIGTINGEMTIVAMDYITSATVSVTLDLSKDEVLENVPVTLDFSAGNQTINAGDGYVVKTAIIQKPETLIPENILADVDIAGVIGTATGGGDTGGSADDLISALLDGSITEISNNNITTIYKEALRNRENLEKVNFPNVTEVGAYAFYYCPKLKTINMPELTSADSYAFCQCSLEQVNFPKLYDLGANAFYGNKALKEVSLLKVATLQNGAFQYCENLEKAEFGTGPFGSFGIVGASVFANCTKLKALILRGTNVATLSTSNCFTASGIADGTGYIYVPPALVDSYKTATNWKTYASQIRPFDYVGITGVKLSDILVYNEVVSINGLYDTGIQETSGNAVLTVTSSDTEIATVSNIVFDGTNISFDVIVGNTKEGDVSITVTVVDGENTYTTTASCTVAASLPYTYSVVAVSGASYGFAINSNGYYESQNKTKSNSAAVCKLEFETNGEYRLYIDCINYAEANYDFGILSNLNTTLGTTYTADSSNVKKSFKGYSSASVQTVDYGVITAGSHYIYVKFRKDNSGNQNNDSLQFIPRFVKV